MRELSLSLIFEQELWQRLHGFAGGSDIISYSVSVGDDQFATPTNVNAPESSLSIYGLERNTSYRLYVSASNGVAANGPAAYISRTTAVSASVPSVPGGLVASLVAGEVSLTWNAPLDTGGVSITGYEVRVGGRTIPVGPGSETATDTPTGTSAIYTVVRPQWHRCVPAAA